MVVQGAQPSCRAPKPLVGLSSHLLGTTPGGRCQYPFWSLLFIAPEMEQGCAATSDGTTLWASKGGCSLPSCPYMTGNTKQDTTHHLPPPPSTSTNRQLKVRGS